MFTPGPNYSKLKTNLRLTINRLKLLEKKKTELTQKARREIADYIANGKVERAKIRVEHIIREDYLIEAMEIVEMYCDLILARFGLVQQMKTLDEGLAEAISSILWATPRLQTDVAELKIISEQLTSKYGKPYAQATRENALKTVNDKLIHKLSVQAPSKVLVEKYLIEIAKSHNVVYEPDPDVMKEDEAEVEPADTLIDFDIDKTNLPPPEPGFIGAGGFIRPPMRDPPFNYPMDCASADERPPLPAVPPSGPYGSDSKPPIGFNVGIEGANPAPTYNASEVKQPNLPTGGMLNNNYTPCIDNNVKPVPLPRTQFPTDTLPELPSVPTTSLPEVSVGGKPDEVDFDDLSKRFEELKKRK